MARYRTDEYCGPTNLGDPEGGLSRKRNQMNPQGYAEAGGSPYGP